MGVEGPEVFFFFLEGRQKICGLYYFSTQLYICWLFCIKSGCLCVNVSGNRRLCSDGYIIYLVLFFPLQWVGSPCGLHGPYIFYKAFQFHLEGKPRILSLGDFFFVRCTPKDPICIAELQLLWEERTSRQLLSSSKLYFLPEDTPQGRNSDHGEVVNLYLPLFFLHYFFP